jgi:hypothetical protein
VRVRITIDCKDDDRWVVQINGREAVSFSGATARIQSERYANALERRLRAAADAERSRSQRRSSESDDP